MVDGGFTPFPWKGEGNLPNRAAGMQREGALEWVAC